MTQKAHTPCRNYAVKTALATSILIIGLRMVRNGLYTRCMLVSSFWNGTSKKTLVDQITCPPLLTLLTKCHSAGPSRWRKHLSLSPTWVFLALILPTRFSSGTFRDQSRLALIRCAKLSKYYMKVLMRRLNLHQLHENRRKSRTIMLKYLEFCSSMRSLVVCSCCLYGAKTINRSSSIRLLRFVLTEGQANKGIRSMIRSWPCRSP